MTVLMLSVKPHYADLILEGKKIVELRKPLIKSTLKAQGCKAYLYASSPVKKVVGECTIVSQGFDTDRQAELEHYSGDPYYEKICRDACITFEDYVGRYDGYEEYTIYHPKRYPAPFDLSDFGIKNPPQSFCYVKDVKDPLCYSCVNCEYGNCLLKHCSTSSMNTIEKYFCEDYAEGSHYSLEEEEEGPTGVVFSFGNGKLSIKDGKTRGDIDE
jgi:predicted transcriptional regulator